MKENKKEGVLKMLSNPYQKYQQNQVETASQEKLLLMLYDGALKSIGNAKEAIDENSMEKAHNEILKTQGMFSELKMSLDLGRGNIAYNLYSLYDFILVRLIEANTKKDKNILNEVEKLTRELRTAWQQAVSKNC